MGENKAGTFWRIVIAVIGAVALCVAAVIGLWQPVVARLVDIFMPIPTPRSPTPIVSQTPAVGSISSTFTEQAIPTQALSFSPTTPPTVFPTSTVSPQPALTPTSSLSLPFIDNFDNGINPGWMVMTGTWRTVDGRLIADAGNQDAEIVVGDQAWSDYVVDVDVFSNSAAGFPVGVIVRSMNGNSLMFRTDCCGTDWILIDGPSERSIAHLDKGGLKFTLTGFIKNHIRVEVVGQTFTGYVDGRQFLQVTDSTNPSGAVGIMSQTPFENRLLFDNFAVTAP